MRSNAIHSVIILQAFTGTVPGEGHAKGFFFGAYSDV